MMGVSAKLKEAIEKRLGELLDSCEETGCEECELRYKGVSALLKKKRIWQGRPQWTACYTPLDERGWSLSRLEFTQEVELSLQKINDRKQMEMEHQQEA